MQVAYLLQVTSNKRNPLKVYSLILNHTSIPNYRPNYLIVIYYNPAIFINIIREIRLELMISIWKTDVIPLNYTRYIFWLNTLLRE